MEMKQERGSRMGNQRGQMIVEALLLMVLLLGVSIAVARYFDSEGVIAEIVSKPWKGLAGIMQNGSWSPPAEGGPVHPNTHRRNVSLMGASPR